jgi:hypothetical protein
VLSSAKIWSGAPPLPQLYLWIHGEGRGGVYLFAGAMEFCFEDFATMSKKKIFIKKQKFYHPMKKVSDG